MTTEKVVFLDKTKGRMRIKVGSTTIDISDMAVHIHSNKELKVTTKESVVTKHYMSIWF